MQKKLYLLILCAFIGQAVFAGNPDRQGEAGAVQLLLTPWARTAGLHTMNTSNISGVEAMRLNVAGMVRMPGKTQIVAGYARYFEGTDINLNAVGVSQRVGENGAFGLELMAVDFGDIPITTTNAPEGTGATYSPSYFNIGFSYAHEFENKVSVGVLLRIVSEGTTNVSATGMALDAGVQYVTGDNDEFKFGIALRNVGAALSYQGEGLAYQEPNPNDEFNYLLNYRINSNRFELPSVLNIGGSYDFIINPKHRVTVLGNFTSNTFSEDQVGGGIEYSFNNMFMLRGAYKYELDTAVDAQASAYDGLSAGVSVQVPFNKEKGSNFGIDYAYRSTLIWSGTHNISVRIDL